MSCRGYDDRGGEGHRVHTFENALIYAREHGGETWERDDEGRVVWFNPHMSMSVILTHALYKGRWFVGS